MPEQAIVARAVLAARGGEAVNEHAVGMELCSLCGAGIPGEPYLFKGSQRPYCETCWDRIQDASGLLLEALEEVEWGGNAPTLGLPRCPCCHQLFETRGGTAHSDDCLLATALHAARVETC